MTRLNYLAKKMRDIAALMDINKREYLTISDSDRKVEIYPTEIEEIANNLDSLERVIRFTQAKVKQWNEGV